MLLIKFTLKQFIDWLKCTYILVWHVILFLFQTPHAVQWMRPESQEGCQVSDWFNILVLHQNRLSTCLDPLIIISESFFRSQKLLLVASLIITSSPNVEVYWVSKHRLCLYMCFFFQWLHEISHIDKNVFVQSEI